MKRLFYITNDLDDAQIISDEVHQEGIDDYHFYVLSRDEQGIKTHHLRGCPKLEKTSILAASRRTLLLTALVLLIVIVGLATFTDLFAAFKFLPVLLILLLGGVSLFIIKTTSRSFDSYFADLFNQHLDAGKVVIVIDVPKKHAHEIEAIMNQHAKAKFIADSSNFNSPIPKKPC